MDARLARILIADDQEDILTALRLLLKAEGFAVDQVSSPTAVLSALDKREYDVLLIDLNYTRDTTSGDEGLDLLARALAADPMLPVVVMTAWGTVDLAVEAMRRGAKDFVQKPWDNARLLTTIRTQASLAAALRRGARLEAQNRILTGDKRPVMIAESASMQPVLSMIERIGPSDANVLITGEPGTGKEVVARTLHAISNRSSQPMVTVNMGGLAEGVFESELFGHVKGAFTDAKTDRVGRFELAEGGTLFLDEIANLPFALQSKLLRVLETGEMERVGSSKTRRADVRVVSATNANLHAESAEGRFRQDLLYRLNTVEIHLPPLRERGEDIPLLASAHLAAMAVRYRKTVRRFDPAALSALASHTWPGNVRELMHVIERAVLMAKGDLIQPADLALRAPSASMGKLEEMSLEEVEELLIRKALARHGGNVSHAADALGLSRSALYRRLQRYQI
ncbi:MAG TPA: sigma-54 dependent transcriptional regulator [Bryobacteraceae bacterium]|nr:sigma-54 dependent transcriptional regulator [Bryobacteraceae bacterium]